MFFAFHSFDERPTDVDESRPFGLLVIHPPSLLVFAHTLSCASWSFLHVRGFVLYCDPFCSKVM